MSEQNFPEDEFDVAEGTRPRGVHRAPEPWWRWMVPFLVVLVVVPALAWGLMYMLSPATPESVQANNADTTASTPSTPESQASAETDEGNTSEGKAENSTSEQSEQAEQPSESNTVNKDVTVRVLNGAGIRGLAGKVSQSIEKQGYAKTKAENAHGWASKVSAVYYSDDNLKATAEDIAKRLNIEEVQAAPNVGKKDIVVLLRKDFRQ